MFSRLIRMGKAPVRAARCMPAITIKSSTLVASRMPSIAAAAVGKVRLMGSSSSESCASPCANQFTSRAMVQQPAPAWNATAVVDGKFVDLKSSQYKGKYLVFFFYPLDFTFVCPTEIIAFSDRVSEFRKLNCEVVGVSVDSKFSHLAWINQARKDGGLGKMQIPLVADITKSISKDYGVLLDEGIALRGLFIIDPKGVLRIQQVNDLPIGRSVDETLRLVKALQYNEKHGEVCPADWKEGAPTIQATPADSKAYFSKVNK